VVLRGNGPVAGVWGGVVGGWCQHVGMAVRAGLRRIGDPVAAAPPAGVRIRARIHPSGTEGEALTAIGVFLGSVYREELAGLIRCGVLDHKGRTLWRAERKRAVTGVASSRGRSPAPSRTSISWGCAAWQLMWRVCVPRLMFWSPGARCARVNRPRRPVAKELGGLGARGRMAAPRNDSPRPAAWPCCARDSRLPSAHWRRGGHRSRGAANACGTPATIWMPRT